jgi:flagellar hook-length control protein FliK
VKATIASNTNTDGHTTKVPAKGKADAARFSAFLKNAQKPSAPASDTEQRAEPARKQLKIKPHDRLENVGRAEPRDLDIALEFKGLEPDTGTEDTAEEKTAESSEPSFEPSIPSSDLAASLAQLSTQVSGPAQQYTHAFEQEEETSTGHGPDQRGPAPAEAGGLEVFPEAGAASAGPHKIDKQADREPELHAPDVSAQTSEAATQRPEQHQLDAIWNKIVKDAPGPGEKTAASPKAAPAPVASYNTSEAVIPSVAPNRTLDAGASTNTGTLIDAIAGNSLLRERLPASSARLLSHPTSGGGVMEVLKLKLHPAELGQMEVAIRKKASAVSIQIRVDNIDAVTSLSADLGAIQAGLKSLGYQVDAVIIEHANSGSAEPPGQQTGGSQTNGNRQSHHTDRRPAEHSPSLTFGGMGTGDEQTSHSVLGSYII